MDKIKKTAPLRKDRIGEHRTALEKNKKYILKTQEVCGICGLPVDKSIKYPDPMSPTVDHIIPIAKGGHPSDLANLQLAHRCCNRKKGADLYTTGGLKIAAPSPAKQTGAVTAQQPHKTAQHKAGPGTEAKQQTDGLQTAEAQPRIYTVTKPEADNDNLPQHVDWTTYKW